MLKLSDLQNYREFLESGGWADAFQYAEKDLRLEMIALVEELLETADAADRLVGQVLFDPEGFGPQGPSSSKLDDK